MEHSGPDVLAVVGAGPGLGRAVAARFAREGSAVGLVARSPARVRALADELATAYDVKTSATAADMARPGELRAALTDLTTALGPPTVLVVNASEWVDGRPTEVDAAAVVHAFEVGVVGALVSAQVVVPAMRAAGHGTVIFTGSVAADRASVSAPTVGIVKAGLRSLARSLHREVTADGVRVATVTIDGVLSGPRALDVEAIADAYWAVHAGGDLTDAEVRFPP